MSRGNAEIHALPEADRAFGSSDPYADRLAEHGYVTEEYRFAAQAGGEHFATRLLVRRPAPEASSGVCVVEAMHFGGGRSFWGHAHEQLVRAGHTWVEVACQTHPALTSLLPSNPPRYGWVSLPGRTTELKFQIGPGTDTRAASDSFTNEWWATSPLLFEIFDAALDAIRRGGLAGVQPVTIIVAGASQSGGVVRRYAEKVARGELPRRMDGFLPLHSGGQPLPEELSVPTYELLAEAEIESVRSAAGLPGQGRGLAHRGCTSPWYRFIEVAGMAHNDARYAVPEEDPPAQSRWSSFPHTHVVHAALEGLIRWIRYDEPPTECAPFDSESNGSLVRDDCGHPRGGLRLPAVEQPTTRIRVISSGRNWNRGHEFPLPAGELLARYGSTQGYLEDVEATLRALVSRGHYLETDARRWLSEAKPGAGTRFRPQHWGKKDGMTGLNIVSRTRTERFTRPFTSGWALGNENGVDLEEVGYVEDEFIVSGTQNTYTYSADWSRQVAQADLPYTTRVLVRRPTEATASSGVVLAESLHPGSSSDSTWRGAHPWIIRNGHTWVGVTTAAGWAATMAESINPARYGTLAIPANGLGWGIMSDVVTSLREGVFHGAEPGTVSRLYLTGWSMTGTFCRVFLGDGFHAESRTPGGAPAVDGYLIGISSGGFIDGGYTPLSDECPTLPAGDPRRTIGARGVPVIELLSENESETHASVLRTDSDTADDPYRLYQVAGSGHSSYRPRDGWPGDDVAQQHRGPATAIREKWSTFPLEFAARAAYEHLDRWVAAGEPAPRAERIPYAATGIHADWPEARPLKRDTDGNAVGGLRSTYVDLPTATFVPHSNAVDDADGQARGWLYPHERPFPAETLLERYGSEENYQELVAERAAALVRDGWLLKEEAELVLEGSRDVRFTSPATIESQQVSA